MFEVCVYIEKLFSFPFIFFIFYFIHTTDGYRQFKLYLHPQIQMQDQYPHQSQWHQL